MSTVGKCVIPLPLSLASLFGTFGLFLFIDTFCFFFTPGTSLIWLHLFILCYLPSPFHTYSFASLFLNFPPLVWRIFSPSFACNSFCSSLTRVVVPQVRGWPPQLTSPWALSIHKMDDFETIQRRHMSLKFMYAFYMHHLTTFQSITLG